jgi:putative adhesin
MTTQRTGLPLTPARRAALAIGVPLALAMIAWSGLDIVAGVGTGSYQIHYPVAVTAGTVNAHFGDANVTLRGGVGPAASLDGTVSYSLVRPKVTVIPATDGTSVGERCVIPAGQCGLDATLTVPRDTSVALSSGGGDLNVTDDGLAATRLKISSTAGDITVRLVSVPRDLEVSDRAGDITVVLPRNSARYRLDVHSAAGDVNDGGVPQSLSSANMITVTDGAGDITVSEAS